MNETTSTIEQLSKFGRVGIERSGSGWGVLVSRALPPSALTNRS